MAERGWRRGLTGLSLVCERVAPEGLTHWGGKLCNEHMATKAGKTITLA